MGRRRIVLVGDGSHCRSVLDCLLEADIYDEIGIVARSSRAGAGPMGFPIVGNDSDVCRKEGCCQLRSGDGDVCNCQHSGGC